MIQHIEILQPEVPDSAIDDRGVVYSYVPKHDIKEFNYIFTKAGSARGHHCHEEFDEYVMLIEGEMIIKEFLDNGSSRNLVLGPGHTVYIPKLIKHVFVPITDCKFVNFLTKPWHKCQRPITKDFL